MKATVVTLDQARRRLTHPVPAEEADAEAPPLLRETGLLVDGEVPLDQAASGRTPQPGPPRPDGSYTPHRLRGNKAEENEHESPVSPSTACHPGKMIGGTLLIAFTDFYVAIPLHIAMFAPALIPGAEPLTPLAVKAVEILDLTVVLPATLLGIKLIADSKCISK